MKKPIEEEHFMQVANKLVSENRYGEAINFLQRIIEEDEENEKAKTLLQQVTKINEYQTRDIFGTLNLDMDPWFE